MKKSVKIILNLVIGVALIACGNTTQNENDNSATKEVEVEEVILDKVSYEVLTDESNAKWSGQLMGVYTHEGNINFKHGILELQGDQIVGGNFIIDMTTIHPTDDNFDAEAGNTREKLIAHLESGDFFLVEEHATAEFQVDSHSGDKLFGKLVIRGVSKDATVEGVKVDLDEGKAEGTLIFNRQDFDVAFTHPIKDMVISNDVKVHVELKF